MRSKQVLLSIILALTTFVVAPCFAQKTPGVAEGATITGQYRTLDLRLPEPHRPPHNQLQLDPQRPLANPRALDSAQPPSSRPPPQPAQPSAGTRTWTNPPPRTTSAGSSNFAAVNLDAEGGVSVYSSPSDRAREVYRISPGERFKIKSETRDGGYIVEGRDVQGKPRDFFVAPSKDIRRLSASQEDQKVFIDLPDHRVSRALRGLNDGKVVAKLDNKSDLQLKDVVLQETGQKDRNGWSVQGRYLVSSKNGEEGWIDKNEAASRKREGVLSKFDASANGACVGTLGPMLQSPDQTLSGLLADLCDEAVGKQMPAIFKAVGACVKDDEIEDKYRKLAKNKVLAAWPQVKNLRRTNGEPATKTDLVNIDLLARTLYGEMETCSQKSEAYPRAVSKLILNRADFAKANPSRASLFIDPDRAKEPNENELTNAILKRKQFSPWNVSDPTAPRILCPPTDTKKPYGIGRAPIPDEIATWKAMVTIAAQSVLGDKSYKNRSRDMRDLYFTSNGAKIEGLERVKNVSVGGEKITDPSCLMMWKDPKLTPEKAPGLIPVPDRY